MPGVFRECWSVGLLNVLVYCLFLKILCRVEIWNCLICLRIQNMTKSMWTYVAGPRNSSNNKPSCYDILKIFVLNILFKQFWYRVVHHSNNSLQPQSEVYKDVIYSVQHMHKVQMETRSKSRREETVLRTSYIVSGQKYHHAYGDVLYWFMAVYKEQNQLLSF